MTLTVIRDNHQQGISVDGQKWAGIQLTTAHLLGYHNDTGCLSGAPNAGNREEFIESYEEVVRLSDARRLNEQFFCDKLSMNVVEIPSRLKGCVSKSKERFVSFGMSTFFHEPSW